MPSPVTAYRVFVASPGGLEEERKHFRNVIQSYNEQDAIERGVIFLPVGWEATLGAVGRPQKIINDDVRRCDFFLMLLWDRWGSPPQAESGEYTSGSEEEFGVASECFTKGTMREIVVLFKDVDPSKLRDPGPELTNVRDFRQVLEREKKLLFETFDEAGAFREKLRRHLARWVRDHEEGGARREPSTAGYIERVHVSLQSPTEAPNQATSAVVRDAEGLAKAGRVSEAEQAFAHVLPDPDLDSLNRYGAFLVEKGSLASAQEIFTRLGDLARERQDDEWLVAGLNNLAGVHQAQGQYDLAEKAYTEALKTRERVLGADHPEVALSLNALAELYRLTRRFDEAESLFRRALAIQGVALGS
jgi:hypothetical protein